MEKEKQFINKMNETTKFSQCFDVRLFCFLFTSFTFFISLHLFFALCLCLLFSSVLHFPHNNKIQTQSFPVCPIPPFGMIVSRIRVMFEIMSRLSMVKRHTVFVYKFSFRFILNGHFPCCAPLFCVHF